MPPVYQVKARRWRWSWCLCRGSRSARWRGRRVTSRPSTPSASAPVTLTLARRRKWSFETTREPRRNHTRRQGSRRKRGRKKNLTLNIYIFFSHPPSPSLGLKSRGAAVPLADHEAQPAAHASHRDAGAVPDPVPPGDGRRLPDQPPHRGPGPLQGRGVPAHLPP